MIGIYESFVYALKQIEILEIIFYFSLIFFRVTANKLFQNCVYTDKRSNVNKISFAIVLY